MLSGRSLLVGGRVVIGTLAVARKQPNLAERYRAHRAAFELALKLGCTPKEAEAELARHTAREEWQRGHARLEALKNAPIHRADPEPPPQPWRLRD